jgi:hypothetical protein
MFIEAVRTVMHGTGITLAALKDKAPRGFWGKVAQLTGQETGAAQTYWRRVKGSLSEEEEARLLFSDERDECDAHDECDEHDAREPLEDVSPETRLSDEHASHDEHNSQDQETPVSDECDEHDLRAELDAFLTGAPDRDECDEYEAYELPASHEEHDAQNQTVGLSAEHAERDECDEREARDAHNGDDERQDSGVICVECAEHDARNEHESHDAHIPWSEMETRMREIAREVVENVMNEMNVMNVQHVMNVNHETAGQDLPPEPQYLKGKKGRRQDRAYKRFTVGVDSNLAKLFEAEMKRLNVSGGRLMDIILWERYGRPKLSFED